MNSFEHKKGTIHMNNSVRLANPAEEIELTDAQLAAIYGAQEDGAADLFGEDEPYTAITNATYGGAVTDTHSRSTNALGNPVDTDTLGGTAARVTTNTVTFP